MNLPEHVRESLRRAYARPPDQQRTDADIAVFADWLEEQGELGDANMLRNPETQFWALRFYRRSFE